MVGGLYKDHDRYVSTYWSRFTDADWRTEGDPEPVYFVGDGCKIDAEGDFWLLGRVDDVMNVSGHRISTIEVESALVEHPTVAEAAVGGVTDAQTRPGIVPHRIL